MLEGPFRVGPWPGLSPSGARVLLGCAVLLALGQLIIESVPLPLPHLLLLGVSALLPLVIATRIVHTPGSASAVCGAYLLPRTLLSLAQPGLELPPLLLVPSLAFDLALWLRAGGQPDRRRGFLAGALFGLVLTVVEPPSIGGDAVGWPGAALWPVAVLTTAAACAVVATLSVRGTAS